MGADSGDRAVGGEWEEIGAGDGVESRGPVLGLDVGFHGAEAEEDAACLAVLGPDAGEVEGVGVVEGDHVAGESRGFGDGG